MLAGKWKGEGSIVMCFVTQHISSRAIFGALWTSLYIPVLAPSGFESDDAALWHTQVIYSFVKFKQPTRFHDSTGELDTLLSRTEPQELAIGEA